MSNTTNKTFFILSLLFALSFWVLVPWHPYPGSALVKVGAVATLAVLALLRREQVGWILPLALLAHGAGDVFLDVDRTRLFLPAMAAFFLGHLGYAWVMISQRLPLSKLSPWRWLGLLCVLVAAGTVYGASAANLKGPLSVAVPIYILAIVAMATSALLGSWKGLLIPLGALSYVLSDSLIAINKFVSPVPWSFLVIWPSYAGAQIAIVFGILAHSKEPDC